MKLNNKWYNILKWGTIIGLPALSTAILGLGPVWGFPTDTIVGTITVLTTFLGTLIGVSTVNYNKGDK